MREWAPAWRYFDLAEAAMSTADDVALFLVKDGFEFGMLHGSDTFGLRRTDGIRFSAE
jgi:hypothetical protein